jgi:replication factor C subunit 3/5
MNPNPNINAPNQRSDSGESNRRSDSKKTIRDITKESSPWSEKYRPSDFNHIVLDPINRKIFEKILEKRKFPHMLFYGPPGAGKTTSADNLIRKYQSLYSRVNKENIIHLNASDERGIEVIRTQIHQFVKSKNMFETGYKFVVLDEVDYMTKNAQQALKNLLQSCLNNVRFCLICNYICKIDDSLKNEFICIRFNQLPKQEIYTFIQNIATQEKMEIQEETIYAIQKMYHSDIRSMINFIQLHQENKSFEKFLMVDTMWENLHQLFLEQAVSNEKDSNEKDSNEKDLNGKLKEWIHATSIRCNLDIKTIIKHYFHYMIQYHPPFIVPSFLNIVENIVHNYDTNIEYILFYFIEHIMQEYRILIVKP